MAAPKGHPRYGGRKKGVVGEIVAERKSVAIGMCKRLDKIANWEAIYSLAKKAQDYRTMIEVQKFWTEKRDGKAPQGHTGDDGGPIVHVIRYEKDPPTPEVVIPNKPAL